MSDAPLIPRRQNTGFQRAFVNPSDYLTSIEPLRLMKTPRSLSSKAFFDCMKVHQAGYPCVVALMGSTLSVRQEKLLEDPFQRVVLMLDGDKAGISAATAIAARLTRKLFVKVVDVPTGRQPDRCQRSRFECC